MVKAYLFDRRRGQRVESWEESLRSLGKNEVLWLDLDDASETRQPASANCSGSTKPFRKRATGAWRPGLCSVRATFT